MKKTSKILLALGYVGGIAMALNFSKKTPKAKKPTTKEEYTKEIIDLHKTAFDSLKEKYLTDEVRSILDEKKEKVLDHVAGFRVEALARFDEIKQEGKGLLGKSEDELKEMYDNRASYFEKAKDLGKEYLDSGKKYLAEEYEDLKKKIK